MAQASLKFAPTFKKVITNRSKIVAELRRLCKSLHNGSESLANGEMLEKLRAAGILVPNMVFAISTFLSLVQATEEGCECADNQLEHLAQSGPEILMILRGVPV